ncbi:MAG TPA: hypothetical protein VFS43_10130 [Polyangiaceae bacterium]|nr:hypothetical protein [Polyangiaceae bacterium]
MSAAPLRLLVFDRTCTGPGSQPGLSDIWAAGRHLYRALGRLDAAHGVASWAEALDWLGGFAPGRPIAEIQYWGHGRWGNVWVGREPLGVTALAPGHAHHERLARVRARLLPGERGLFWFRTCETFGTASGHDFARRWSRFFGCRAAGHTYVIGAWQSGLHSLLPGDEPSWPLDEGVRPGPRDGPGDPSGGKALASHRRAPNTITFLHGRVPAGY